LWVIRRVVIALVACAIVIAAAVFLISLFREAPRPPAATEAVATPAPRASEPSPAPVREPSAAAAPRTARPASEPAPEAPPPEAAPEAPPDVATLRIQTDVPGAQVFIDRQFIGTAPATAENVKPGTHQLNVSAEGFESVVDTIDVAPGPRDISVKFREVRLNSGIDVIHKHRIGSCKGRLVATAQGLRYETADKEDAFTVPLMALEAFQVDYLEKNLRVRLPKGRQFNFTDPDGNADHLFVFHRDVEKARERLRKGDAPATN
jgi:hypothetical protein